MCKIDEINHRFLVIWQALSEMNFNLHRKPLHLLKHHQELQRVYIGW